MDASSESRTAPANHIKAETKHYFKSGLDLRELTAEILQAAKASDFDLWVLAATCAVSAQHAAELEAHAAERGVECLFLDRPGQGLSRLYVLMAAHRDVVGRFARDAASPIGSAALDVALEAITHDAGYADALAQILGKLSGTALGYEDASRRAARTLSGWLSDDGTAEAEFNQRIAVKAPGSGYVRRGHIHDLLTTWWAGNPAERRHAVALGEEGEGKSWAVFAWAEVGAGNGRLPLTLVFNASVHPLARGATIATVLPELLTRHTGLHGKDRWERRLQAWLADQQAPKPLLLIVVDGLNERTDVDWISFFRPLLHTQMRGRVVVLATDRPGHWEPECKRLERDGFCPIPVDGYADAELAEALDGSGVPISEIPDGLHELIRTPRYCTLVGKYFDEMRINNDFTKERLILIDARCRRDDKRGHPLSEDDFYEVIRALASRWQHCPNFSRQDLHALLPGFDASRQTYQEIIDGGLLVRSDSATGRRFTVEPTRLVFGLGMLLADDVRVASNGQSATATAEIVARWLEPHAEMDLKVRICASAIFHALLDPEYPGVARRELIRIWLSARNRFGDEDEARLAFVLRAPDDFVSIAESFWSSRGDKGSAQAYLAMAFSQYREHDVLEPLLVEAVERWAGYVHPAGSPLLRHGGAAEDSSRRAAISARIGHTPIPGPLEVAGKRLTIVEDDGLLRLIRFGLLLMSAGRRSPFAGALATWAVAAAVSGGATEWDAAAWVVRFATDDPESSIVDEARTLLARGEVVATTAAHTLLEVAGTKAAAKLQAEFPLPVPHETTERIAKHNADPCNSFYAWSEEQCERCIDEQGTRLDALLNRAELSLLDPQRLVPDHLLTRLSEAVGRIDPAAVHATFGPNFETQRFEDLLPFAARVPTDLLAFMRRVVASMPARTLQGKRQLALQLPGFQPVMQDSEAAAVREVVTDLRRGGASWPRPDAGPDAAQTAEAFSTLGLLPGMSPDERHRYLMARPPNAFDLDDFEPWLEPPSEAIAQEALRVIRTGGEDASPIRALWLAAHHRAEATAADRDAVVALACASDPLARGLALRFACMTENEDIGRQIVDLGLCYDDPDNPWENEWGNKLLSRFGGHIAFEELSRRVDPAAASFHLVERGCLEDDVRRFAAALNAVLNEEVFVDGSPSQGGVPPQLRMSPASGALKPGLAPLAEAARPDRTLLSASASWTSGSEAGGDTLGELLNPLDDETDMRAAASPRDAAAAARRMPAFKWYAHRFHPDALAAVIRSNLEMGQRWADEATAPGQAGRRLRMRLGAYCFSLCQALLKVDPDRGIRLMKALKDPRGTVSFDEAELLFDAPRSTSVLDARESTMRRCLSDASVAAFARTAQRGDDAWLIATIERLVTAPPLRDRALGLALAAFSRRESAEIKRFADLADIQGTWVADVMPALHRNHRRDVLAGMWFDRFWAETAPDAAWVALQVVAHLADQRFELRFSEIEAESHRASTRSRMIKMNRFALKQALKNKRDRENRLFSIRIQKDQIFPFIGDDAMF
ncbi:hypothetical protein QR78_23985 [Methylobacterium indicum]|uniref:NACHT domain-containing protein n=2 Tax=Methylobacterium indicum TaxID=1775910 RepID=A0ABR5HIA6_9HYPH|nr:hypothetical protein QR78_23985 [Methylobacterium indicum]KMO26374.1 hypothetical protein QR79_02830 [Methylobacterium indicum]